MKVVRWILLPLLGYVSFALSEVKGNDVQGDKPEPAKDRKLQSDSVGEEDTTGNDPSDSVAERDTNRWFGVSNINSFVDWVSSFVPNPGATQNQSPSISPSAPPSSSERPSNSPSAPPSSSARPSERPSNGPSAPPSSSERPSNTPTLRPSGAPTNNPTERGTPLFNPCWPFTPFVTYPNIKSAMSYMEGEIIVEWMSPFVFTFIDFYGEKNYTGAIDDIFPVACGAFSYKVFVYMGNWTIDAENFTSVDELTRLVDEDPNLEMFETSEKSLTLTGLMPGTEYSILVRGIIDGGPQTRNSLTSVVLTSSNSPVIRSNYTSMTVVPYPDNDIYNIEFLNETIPHRLNITGDLPAVLEDVQLDDYIHFVANDLTTYIVRVDELLESTENAVLYQVAVVPLTGIFDSLEVSGVESSIEEQPGTTDQIVTSVSEQDAFLFIDRLREFGDEEVWQNFCEDFNAPFVSECVAVLNGSLESRRSLHQRRRLCDFFCRLGRGARQFVEEVVVKPIVEPIVQGAEKLGEDIVEGAEDFVEGAGEVVQDVGDFLEDAVEEVVDTVVKIGEKILTVKFISARNVEEQLINFDSGVTATCSLESGNVEGSIEVGLGFYLRVTTRFSLEVSLSRQTASFQLEGAFGIQGYVLMEASASATYEPDPFKFITFSKTIAPPILGIPVVITFRPNIEAFLAASVSIEGQAFAAFGRGYSFSVGFSFDSDRPGDGFENESRPFEREDLMIPDPLLEVRARADVETGLTFSFDVVLYGLLQGSISADLGVSAGVEIAADLDTILVTRPYFVTLNEFGITLFVNVRLFVGLNTAITDFLAGLIDGASGGDDAPACEIEFGTFEFPELEEDDEEEETAIEALSGTVEEGIASFENIENIGDLFDAVGGLEDLYADAIENVVNVLEEGIGATLEVFAEEIPIITLPEITIEARENNPVQYCIGDNAIILNLDVAVEADGLIETGISSSDGVWFGNFDAAYFPLTENNGWEISGGSAGATAVLKRASFMPSYALDPNATVFFRGTPDLLPIKFVMMASEVVSELIDEDVDSFECCDDSDCVFKFSEEGRLLCVESTCISPPSSQPSATPSSRPSSLPSNRPTSGPSQLPSETPTTAPSSKPSVLPSLTPTLSPTAAPSSTPSTRPSASPTNEPSGMPSAVPSVNPSESPTTAPSTKPSAIPSVFPSLDPSANPSEAPSAAPSAMPSAVPSASPSKSSQPSANPSEFPSVTPSKAPSTAPSAEPSSMPSMAPTGMPTESLQPSHLPTLAIIDQDIMISVASTGTRAKYCEEKFSPFTVGSTRVDFTILSEFSSVLFAVSDQYPCDFRSPFGSRAAIEFIYVYANGDTEVMATKCDFNDFVGGLPLQGDAIETVIPYSICEQEADGNINGQFQLRLIDKQTGESYTSDVVDCVGCGLCYPECPATDSWFCFDPCACGADEAECS